jgi:hypothetical protein
MRSDNRTLFVSPLSFFSYAAPWVAAAAAAAAAAGGVGAAGGTVVVNTNKNGRRVSGVGVGVNGGVVAAVE